MQPYQFTRRRGGGGARVIAVNIFKRKKVVNFTNLSIFKNILQDWPLIILNFFFRDIKKIRQVMKNILYKLYLKFL